MAIAGALTIASPLQSYILAMVHHPVWQTKMQEEIERVCGERCPEWEDREHLPVVRSVVKEILRWRPPVPTGKPYLAFIFFGQKLTSSRYPSST